MFFDAFVRDPVVFVQFIVRIVLTQAACSGVFVFYCVLDFCKTLRV